MRAVEASKFLGIKVWEDDENYQVLRNVIPNAKEENKRKLLEFKNVDEIDSFIKKLKRWKKDFVEINSER